VIDQFDDADDLVAVVEDGVAGVAGGHRGPDVGDGVGGPHEADLHPRDHGVLHVAAGEVDDAVDDGADVVGQGAAGA